MQAMASSLFGSSVQKMVNSGDSLMSLNSQNQVRRSSTGTEWSFVSICCSQTRQTRAESEFLVASVLHRWDWHVVQFLIALLPAAGDQSLGIPVLIDQAAGVIGLPWTDSIVFAGVVGISMWARKDMKRVEKELAEKVSYNPFAIASRMSHA